MLVLGFPEYDVQAKRLAESLGAHYACVGLHRFPDNESKISLPASMPAQVVFCRSLNAPNDKLIELMLAAKTAQRLGAKTLTLVAPYLCYMRQDIAFHEGEAVSQSIIGQWLAEMFDDVITVDPHLHRTPTLAAAVPARRALALTAAGLIGEFLSVHAPGAFILGPDEESVQWVRAVAKPYGFDHAVCRKVRGGDLQVQIALPDADLRGRQVVLVDDMVSTGHTIEIAALHCFAAGAETVDVFASHALFVENAQTRMRAAGVRKLWSTDSIADPGNVVPLDRLLADAVRGGR